MSASFLDSGRKWRCGDHLYLGQWYELSRNVKQDLCGYIKRKKGLRLNPSDIWWDSFGLFCSFTFTVFYDLSYNRVIKLKIFLLWDEFVSNLNSVASGWLVKIKIKHVLSCWLWLIRAASGADVRGWGVYYTQRIWAAALCQMIV